MCHLKSSNVCFMSSILVLILFSLARGTESGHTVEKRQVGVLARTGALPQGKRSVSALARNGELPIPRDDKRDSSEENVLDQLIRELGTAEGLSRLKAQALAERFASDQDDDYDEIGKRSVSALARNSQLPQKRVVTHRSGYLIRPSSPGSADEETDLLDPDDFLGKTGVGVLGMNGGFIVADGSLASFAKHGYEDDGEEAYFDDDYEDGRYPGEKRHIGAARNFFSGGKSTVGSPRGLFTYGGRGKRNLGAFKNFGKRTVASALNFGKRNVGAARNFLLSDKRNIAALKNLMSGKRNVGAARNFLLGESKRNLGTGKNFLVGGKRNLGAAKNFMYGKRNMAAFARDGGFGSLKYPSANEYDWDNFFDFDDFHDEEEKRNLASFKNFGKRSADLGHANGELVKDGKQEMASNVQEKENNKTRTKREAYLDAATDEYPMPVLQASGEFDYGDLEALADDLNMQKRFLGSVASWPKNQDYLGVTKRHIGALARLGWLPSFQAIRYSRSGRAISSRSMAPFRPNTSIGTCPTENANPIWSAPPSVETKMALGTKGIFRRVGRSALSSNANLLEPQSNHS